MFHPGLASRIDVLGAAGVGKSTYSRRILRSDFSLPASRLLDVEQSRRLATDNALKYGLPRLGLAMRARQCTAKIRQSLIHLTRGWGNDYSPNWRQIEGLKRRDVEEFLENYSALFDAVVLQWFDPEMLLPSLPNRYHEMLLWTTDLLFYSRWSSRVIILADNARFTKALAELFANSAFECSAREDFFRCYLESPIGPKGVIHFHARPELVVERIQQRVEEDSGGKMHPAHQGLSPSELLSYSKRRQENNWRAVSFLKSESFPVLNLDVEESDGGNCEKIHRFLAQFDGG